MLDGLSGASPPGATLCPWKISCPLFLRVWPIRRRAELGRNDRPGAEQGLKREVRAPEADCENGKRLPNARCQTMLIVSTLVALASFLGAAISWESTDGRLPAIYSAVGMIALATTVVMGFVSLT